MKILLVEDEEMNREIIERCLCERGHEVRAVADAESAIEAAARELFDVILLDVGLPGLSGLAALPRLRESSSAAVLVMTGHSDEEIKKDARLLGAAGFLAKPVGVDELVAAVEAARRSS